MNSDSAINLHPLVPSPAPPDSCTTQSLNHRSQHGWQQEGKPCPATCQQSRISIEIIQKYLEMPTANGQEQDQNQYDILDEM
jgi:hypothetical protein